MFTIDNRRKLRLLQDEVKALEASIKADESVCRHSWGEAVYDPTTSREPYGSKFVAQGSDCWSEPEGYHDVQHPRWRRNCQMCGMAQYGVDQPIQKQVIERKWGG